MKGEERVSLAILAFFDSMQSCFNKLSISSESKERVENFLSNSVPSTAFTDPKITDEVFWSAASMAADRLHRDAGRSEPDDNTMAELRRRWRAELEWRMAGSPLFAQEVIFASAFDLLL
jgi:hypothetical protein